VKTALKYGAGLIALYLVVYYATGAGNDINAGQSGLVNTIKAFQGR
jgi:hypothetical protein